MPYTIDKPPEEIKKLPKDAQKVFITAFNSYIEKGFTEERAFKSAWGAVKQNWKQNPEGEWVKKMSEEVDLPEELQAVWNAEYKKALKAGNNELTSEKLAWTEVKKNFKKTKKGWVPIKSKAMSVMKNFRMLKENTPISYDKETVYKDGDILQLQFCCVGENIHEKELNQMITNFENGALGQSIGLHVDHPFFLDIPSDTRRYGDILKIYRRGSHEGWIEVRLNGLGARTFQDRSYAYLSPGWWGRYEHRVTGEKVENVPFEVSLTNMPAEKMMQAVIAMMEEPDKPEEPEEEEPEKEKPEDKEPEEEETLEAMIEALKSYGGRIISAMKNKSGNTARRAKFKDFLGGLSISKKSEEKEAENMPDEEMVKILEERNTEIKNLKERVDKAESEMKQMTEVKRRAELKTLAESYLPTPGKDSYLIKKENLDETVEHLKTLSEDQVKSWKSLMDKSPVLTVETGVKGTGLTKEEPKPKKADENVISENEFEKKVRKASEKDPDYNNRTKRKDVMAKHRKELAEKFKIEKEGE